MVAKVNDITLLSAALEETMLIAKQVDDGIAAELATLLRRTDKLRRDAVKGIHNTH